MAHSQGNWSREIKSGLLWAGANSLLQEEQGTGGAAGGGDASPPQRAWRGAEAMGDTPVNPGAGLASPRSAPFAPT